MGFPILAASDLYGMVTAKIGLYVESDLSMYFQEIPETNLLGFFGVAGNTYLDPILREIRF
jgi:hypothetical protein